MAKGIMSNQMVPTTMAEWKIIWQMIWMVITGHQNLNIGDQSLITRLMELVEKLESNTPSQEITIKVKKFRASWLGNNLIKEPTNINMKVVLTMKRILKVQVCSFLFR
jgi:hypothetical protein